MSANYGFYDTMYWNQQIETLDRTALQTLHLDLLKDQVLHARNTSA